MSAKVWPDDTATKSAGNGNEPAWVKITDYGESCLVGTLDSFPKFTKLLQVNDMIHFHPKHIVNFWSDEPSTDNPVSGT